MKITVQGKNGFEVTTAIEEYLNDKVSKISNYFKDTDGVDVRAVLKVYNSYQKVEITIQAKHILMRAEEKNADMYAAIDFATDKLVRQIRKHKDRLNSSIQNRNGIKNYFMEKEEVNNDDLVVLGKVVKRKEIRLKPMHIEEAILQMEMLGHEFFMYHDDETDSVCTVYKRADGEFGILES